MVQDLGKGEKLVRFLKDSLNINISARLEALLEDTENEHYVYDLLGVLKSGMVEKFYIPATSECPPVSDVIRLCTEIGAISAYAYLGDVGDSVTETKRRNSKMITWSYCLKRSKDWVFMQSHICLHATRKPSWRG